MAITTLFLATPHASPSTGRNPPAVVPSYPPANTRKTSYRKLMQERTKVHLSDVVAEATVRSKPHANSGDGGGASSSKLVKLSPEGNNCVLNMGVAGTRGRVSWLSGGGGNKGIGRLSYC